MMWECECGHIEYSQIHPEECGKCFRIESFKKVPDEIADEKEEELIKKVLKKNENKKKKKVKKI